MAEQRYLHRKEAAQYLTERGLKVSAGTLAKYATVGGGPDYQHFGNRPVYTPASLDAWIASRLSEPCCNTSRRR
ncbi:MAG: helix-turn-helix transcriptional regulator [Methylocystis sp.]